MTTKEAHPAPSGPGRRRWGGAELVARSAFNLAVGVILSLACAASTILWKREGPEDPFTVATLLWVAYGGIFFAFAVPLGLTLYALIGSVRVPTKKAGLAILFMTYMAIIMSFASLYYVIAWRADLEDAEGQFTYYDHLQRNWPAGEGPPPYRAASDRAFRGIEGKLWTGVEDAARPAHYKKDMNAPVPKILETVEWLRKNQPSFVVRWSDSPTQLQVFLDCLHFSIVTMSTVGYGDITPQSRLAKAVTDLQILSGTVLFLFALGYVFGKQEAEAPLPKGWQGHAAP